MLIVKAFITGAKYEFKECPSCRGTAFKIVGTSLQPPSDFAGQWRNPVGKTFYKCESCGKTWKHSFGTHPEPASDEDLKTMYPFDETSI